MSCFDLRLPGFFRMYWLLLNTCNSSIRTIRAFSGMFKEPAPMWGRPIAPKRQQNMGSCRLGVRAPFILIASRSFPNSTGGFLLFPIHLIQFIQVERYSIHSYCSVFYSFLLFAFKTDPAIVLAFGAWRNPPLHQVFIGLTHQAFRKLSSSFFSSLKLAHSSAQVSALFSNFLCNIRSLVSSTGKLPFLLFPYFCLASSA